MKLESELLMEKEMRNTDEYPESVKDYLDNSPFKVSFQRRKFVFTGIINVISASRHARSRGCHPIKKVQ